MRCPFCPKKYQSKKDLHKHLKKIHDADMDDATLDSVLRELRIGDICDWNEDNVNLRQL